MNLKTWVPLVLAIVLGLVAAKFANSAMQARKNAHGGLGQLTQIAVSKRALSPGQSLTADDLTMGEVGKNSVPDSSFSNSSDLIGRVVEIPEKHFLFFRHVKSAQLACFDQFLRQALKRKLSSRKSFEKIDMGIRWINRRERFGPIADHRKHTATRFDLIAKRAQIGFAHERHVDGKSEQMSAAHSRQ